MTSRSLARLAALAVTGAIALAACGGDTPTAEPTAMPTQAPPTDAAGTQAPGFSFALPSGFNADQELEGLLPDELGGATVIKFSMSGTSFLGTGQQGSEEVLAVLTRLGKTPADLSVAFGGTEAAAVFAYRIKGVDATAFYATFLDIADDAQGATITDESIAGKSVKKVVTDSGETIYLYASGDALFGVGGDDVSGALLTEALTKLP